MITCTILFFNISVNT